MKGGGVEGKEGGDGEEQVFIFLEAGKGRRGDATLRLASDVRRFPAAVCCASNAHP